MANTEPSNCKASWKGKDIDLAYCPIHNQYFWTRKGQTCKYYTSISDGEPKSEKVMSSGFTSNSQAITSNSQGVPDLSITCKPKRKYNRKVTNSIWERFHNYGVKFNAEVMWDALFKYEEVRLRNNVSYKRVDLPLAIVKVFRRSILVTLRSSKEIVGLDVRSAESKAIGMVVDTVKALPKAIVVSDSDLSSIHNAFVNHPTAKLFKEVFDREMVVKDDVGDVHLITDNSHGRHELEYPNKDTAVDKSVWREQYEADLIFNKPEFPSVQGKRIESNAKDIGSVKDVLSVLKDDAILPLTAQLKLHLGVEEKQDKNMDLMNVNLRKQNELLERQNILLEQSKPQSKKDKARKILDKFGW